MSDQEHEEAAEQRASMRERWEAASAGWGKRADRVRAWGMPVSEWLIDHLQLQPGQRVLELAAGPGDTGLLAAELIKPGGVLISSDGADGMVALARARADALGIDNVEFKRLELEWIDLPTASVDAVVCRWGVMLVLDPSAALQEMRRVLRPGGRIALAVWDEAAWNPWATVPGRALIELGHAEPPKPGEPGMFALAPAEKLRELIESAGFLDVVVDEVELERAYERVEQFIADTLDLSSIFSATMAALSEAQRAEVEQRIASSLEPFARPDGSLTLPGRTLAAAGSA